ncbi:hypothetical protein A5659_19500 [Mycobacterium sp. 1165196.3]|uniref:Rv1535 family protein n=1 Tax=Mycobacterium sp. 1165196.3 TaxID=1834071 RepID=UPI000800712C|nr:Rv1535 family protein [Mycobacterium sp. 1165196.3]OBK36089.1 hypothetical protein A5659_19500 [Mycobacterium sp. 1165196.3]
MTAVRYDDVVPAATASAATQPASPRRQPAASPTDPLMAMTTRLLSIPLHQLYAALWRVGVLEVRA